MTEKQKGVVAIAALMAPIALLSSCGAPAATGAQPVKPEPFAVPISAGCVAGAGRPQKPQPLNQRYTPEQWAALQG